MAETANNQNNYIFSQSWTEGLLVKEKDGTLKRYISGQKNTSAPVKIQDMSPASTDIGITIAPADDSFRVNASSAAKPEESADFSFHPDDKSQLEQIGQTLAGDRSQKYSLEKINKRIVEKHALRFDSATNDKFNDLTFDFFRGRKKAHILRENLAKLASAGHNLTDVEIDSVVSVVKGIRNRIDSVGGIVVRAQDLAKQLATDLPEMAPAEIAVPAFVKAPYKTLADQTEASNVTSEEKQVKVSADAENTLTKEIPLPKDKIDLETAPESRSFSIPKPTDKVISVDTQATSSTAGLPKVVRPSQTGGSQRAAIDVVSRSRGEHLGAKEFVLTGPVQELQNMTLRNFRYLGDTLEDRMEKLKDKFDVLEQDSFTKRAQGVEAWRSSPVYKLYSQTGSESMSKSVDIEAVVQELEKSGQPTLNYEEFAAISDLNKQLRF